MKRQLHGLVDMLPEEEIPAAGRFLQFLVDKASEPLPEADFQAVREGQTAIASGEFTSLDEMKRELSL